MRRRIGAIALAAVLAVFGTAVLIAYVNTAKDNAVKDTQQVPVLIVSAAIPQGATIAAIRVSTTLTEVPQRLVTADTMRTLDGVEPALVAAIPLQPGEQLLRSRLVDPTSLERVDVPADLQEMTLALAPERALGGALLPGDKVGVILSFEPFRTGALTSADGAAPTTTSASQTNTTHLTLQQVLVTSVQYSVQDSERRNETQTTGDGTTPVTTVSEAPSQVLLVTLALTAAQAEQIAFAAEFGHIWLTRQTTTTAPDGSRIVTIDQIYVAVPQ